MGIYDSVVVPCPQCGTKAEFQSKGGDCLLDIYELDDAPDDVLSDVNRHAPHECIGCGVKYGVRVSKKIMRNYTATPVIWPGIDDADE